MSDHRSTMPPFNDAEQRSSTATQNKKNKWFHRKIQRLEGNGYVAGQHKYNYHITGSGHDQTPHQNVASIKGPPPSTSTQNEGLFYQAGAASASHCSSRPSASTHGMLLERGIGSHYIGVNMLDHRSTMPPFNDTEQRISATKRRKINKQFRRKMQRLEGNDYVAGQHNHFEAGSVHDQTPHQNGALPKVPPPSTSTQNEGLFHQASTASASHCSSRPSASTHSMPSLTITVLNQDSHTKPKEPVKPTSAAAAGPGPSSQKPTAPSGIPTKYLAIDCEMVGVGPKGSVSQLARCSIVSYEGDVVYDKFIKPPMPITDYRTRWSGIRRCDLINATPYTEARKEILKLINGKVVIGHAIHNDFKVLSYSHANALTRDTSRMPLLNQRAGFPENQCASLKRLTKAIFNRDIQTGKKGHSSVEDARASLALYKEVEEEWERKLTCKSHTL